MSGDLVQGEAVVVETAAKTEDGSAALTITVELVSDGRVVINGGAAAVVVADVEASNGVAHGIDAVLVPPGVLPPRSTANILPSSTPVSSSSTSNSFSRSVLSTVFSSTSSPLALSTTFTDSLSTSDSTAFPGGTTRDPSTEQPSGSSGSRADTTSVVVPIVVVVVAAVVAVFVLMRQQRKHNEGSASVGDVAFSNPLYGDYSLEEGPDDPSFS